MKWFKSLLCVLFIAALVCSIPCGCGSNEATQIDTSGMEDEDPEGEADVVGDPNDQGSGGDQGD